MLQPQITRRTSPVTITEAEQLAMNRALTLAEAAAEVGEIPVGAVVLDAEGTIIGSGRNQREESSDPTGHAEILALREAASKVGSWNLSECTLVITMEPCLMCAGATLQARIPKVIFAAWDEKAGAAGSAYDVLRDRRLPYRAEVIGGIQEAEAVAILQAFFRERR